MSLPVILSKTACTLGLYAVSGGAGFGLGESVAGNWLSEQLPSVFRSLLPNRLRDPNHDLTRAFHAAVRDTLIQATGQRNPLKAFQHEHAAEWGTLHAGLQQAIQQWHTDLIAAAKASETAGQSPLIEVDDGFLKTLAEDGTGDAIQDVQRQLRAALRERLGKVENQSDEEADRAAALFIDWFSRQIGAQLGVHFWEQLKTDEKARTAYFGLVAESLQQLLGEVAGHAVGMRQDIQQLSQQEQERHQAIGKALAVIQQVQVDQAAADKVLSDLITQGQERLEQTLSIINSQLGRIDRGVQQLLDGHQPPLHHSAPSSPVRVQGVIAISDLDYRQRLIPFQPRSVELDRLDAFLHSPQRFVWWGVVGDGGMGKSRLAQELVQRCREAGWEAGFLERGGQEWMKTGHRSWQPAFPTLIVLDYASERVAELLSFLSALQERAAELRQPVRVLLLDRPGAVGPLFSDLLEKLSPTTDGHARLAALRALWQPFPGPAPQAISESHLLQLDPPSPCLWTRYFDLILAALGQPPREWPATDQEFWQHMRRITHSGRPLYLQMAAIALHFEAASSGDSDLHLTTRTATDLLDALLRHELTTRWPFILKAQDALDLEPALRRAVGLVTLTRGLDLTDQDQLQMLMAAAIVPAGREETFKAALCALLHPEAQTQALPPLQPDLLGERYLLLGGATPSSPGRANAFGAPPPQPYFQAADWLPEALGRRTGKVTEALSLLVQDFPTAPALLPLLETAMIRSIAWAKVDTSTFHDGEVAQGLLAVMTQHSLSWFPSLVHLARQGQPLPSSLITPLLEAIRGQTQSKIQHALLVPLILLREECGKDPALLTWTTWQLLPIQEALVPHLQRPVALLAARAAFNAVNHYGNGGPTHFPDMERWLTVLTSTAQPHPQQPEIQIELADGAYSSINSYGSSGPAHFLAMERWLQVLTATAQAHPQQIEIQLRLAQGALYASIYYGSAGPAHFLAMERWLAALTSSAQAHPQQLDIQLELAKGAFNAVNSYGSGGLEHFPALERWLQVLVATAQVHPQHSEIQLQLAKGAFNAICNYCSAGPEHFPALESCLQVLVATAQAHPQYSEIQLQLFQGAFNASIGYGRAGPEHFPNMERWLAELTSTAQAQQPEIQLLLAQGAFNTVNNYCSGGPVYFPDMERWLQILAATAQAHPQHPEIQLQLATGSLSASIGYGRAGPEHFPDMERWLQVLVATAQAHPQHSEIQVQLADAAFNASSSYGRAGPEHFPNMERWLHILETTVQAHPQHTGIHLTQSMAAYNAINGYCLGGPEHLTDMESRLHVLTNLSKLDPEVMNHLPDLINFTCDWIYKAAKALGGDLSSEWQPALKALLDLCLRYPDLPLERTPDGRTITTGQWAAEFLSPKDPPA